MASPAHLQAGWTYDTHAHAGSNGGWVLPNGDADLVVCRVDGERQASERAGLLEALRAIEEYANREAGSPGEPLYQVARAARAALAKVDGGTP